MKIAGTKVRRSCQFGTEYPGWGLLFGGILKERGIEIICCSFVKKSIFIS
jgi:hypothetical protein